jgi:hypothetical protein
MSVAASNGSVPAIATIEASTAEPLRCNTSHGNATMEMPLPAPAASAAKKIRNSGPFFVMVMGIGWNLTAAMPSRERISARAQWGHDAAASAHG